MIEEFAIHNQFNESITRYRDYDPHLKRANNAPFLYTSPLLLEKAFRNPGIYVITGGRQVGKSTFLKQFILRLLEEEKTNPQNILFLTGEIIDSHHILRRIIEEFQNKSNAFKYLFIDEINYIPDWDKSIKYMADIGLFDESSIILTGSDSQIIKTALKRFPGRRGREEKTDFTFHPLSFKEFVCLKNNDLQDICDQIVSTPISEEIQEYSEHHTRIMEMFYDYLIHGGYLPAISDYHLHGDISGGVLNTYIQWIIGDMLKHKKSEHYLFEILRGIKKTYNSQISWNSIGKHLSIDHHKTISDYCQLLEGIHVLHIVEALIEHKLIGAPKKNRKLYFRDPFIDHSVTSYIDSSFSMKKLIETIRDNAVSAPYVEAVVVDHCKRVAPSYYIKGTKGEVDVAIVRKGTFFPYEVKWTSQIRPGDLKQIKQYREGIILTPNLEGNVAGNIRTVPLVRFLIHICGTAGWNSKEGLF